MIPVYQQGQGEGIGCSIDDFEQRLISTSDGAKVAIILRDFTNREIAKSLKRLNVFANLDRLSRTRLSIYYANSPDVSARFNRIARNNVDHQKRAVVYIVLATFLVEIGFTHVETYELAKADDVAISQIYEIVSNYISNEPPQKKAGWEMHPAIGALAIQAFAGYLGNVAAK